MVLVEVRALHFLGLLGSHAVLPLQCLHESAGLDTRSFGLHSAVTVA